MIAWELLKELVKARQELQRVREKYFLKPAEWHLDFCPSADQDLLEGIRLINKSIEELTFNLINEGKK